MTLRIYIWVFLLSSFSIGCHKTESEQFNLSDLNFVKSIKGGNSKNTVLLIDSIINESSQNTTRLALLYFKKGNLMSKLQNEDKAVINFELALDLFEQLGSIEYMAETYWHLGSAHAFLSNKVTATDYLLKALTLNQENNDETLEANIYGSLAHVHYLYKDYNKAINYTFKAIDIQLVKKDSLELSVTFNNLAVIYKNLGDYSNALKYNVESLNLNLLTDNQLAIAKSYNNLGLVSEKLKNTEQATDYYIKAIKLHKELGTTNSTALRNLGSLYLRSNKIKKSKDTYLQALEIEKRSTKNSIKKDIYNILLHISLQEGDLKNSLKYQEKRDSIFILQTKIDNKESLNLIEHQYQLISKEHELLQEKTSNKKNKIIFAILAILLVITSLFFRQTAKNRKLKDEKEKIILKQQVLRSQMNPHFIFNALSAIQNSLLDNEPIKSASYLSRFAKLIRQNFDFINQKTILLKDEIDALQNYIDTQKLRFHDRFDSEIIISPNIDINIVEIPPLLLQPFVENAIEHGFKNKKKQGKITLSISKKDAYICYEIVDNGNGFQATSENDKIHSIDDFKKRLYLLGNKDEKTFKINTSEKGTIINFCIKQC